MSDEQIQKPEDYALTKLADDLASFNNLDDEAVLKGIEDFGLRGELIELLNHKLGYGDVDDIRVKAERALLIGLRQIDEGKVSKEFLQYIALGIRRTLCGQEKSLDQAFRLERKPGRQPLPPQRNDPIVYAFLASIQCYVPWQEEPSRGMISFDEIERRALSAAYLAMHGKCPWQHLEQGLDPKSVTDRMTATKRVLEERGYYNADKNRGRVKK